MLVCLALVSPHLYWSAQHGWPTLHYMHTAHEVQTSEAGVDALIEALTRVLLFGVVALVVWCVGLLGLPALTRPQLESRTPRLGLSLFILSLLLTLLVSWMENLQLTAPWFIPSFLLLGWALVDLTPSSIDWDRYMRRMQGMTMVVWGLVASGAVLYEGRYREYPAPPPDSLAQKVAEDVTQLYHQTYHQPIRYAAGSFPYPYVLSFYSPDHPKGLDGLNLSGSFWIDSQALMRKAKVVICGKAKFQTTDDPSCEQEARHLLGLPAKSITLSYSVYDPKCHQLGVQHYRVLMYSTDKPMAA